MRVWVCLLMRDLLIYVKFFCYISYLSQALITPQSYFY